MERRFSMNDFEQSLKEHADEFKMLPSKRVWHGIYNDLHPGRRWPSVAVSLLLISTLIIIGHLNNRMSSQKSHSNLAASVQSRVIANDLQVETTVLNNKKANTAQTNILKNHANVPERNIVKKDLVKNGGVNPGYDATNSDLSQLSEKKLSSARFSHGQSLNKEKPASLLPKESNSNVAATQVLKGGLGNSSLNNDFNNSEVNYFNSITTANGHMQQLESARRRIALDNDIYNLKVNSEDHKSGNLSADKKNVEGDRTTAAEKAKKLPVPSGDNKKAVTKVVHRKRNDKINWVYFVTPELNSVTFRGEPIRPMSGSNSPAVSINQKGYNILNKSAFGFEVATEMTYSIIKKLKFTTGLQLNYSGYKITSNEVHPTYSTLILRNPQSGILYAKNYLTHYGDGTGQASISIRNYSLQASVPIGLEYQFGGSNKIQFNAGANIAPSLALKSNAYLLSSDGNNYIKDPSLLRNWNMASNFYISMAFTSSKLRWQIGPDVRYQWLSTYKKDYTIQEHLIDYGIRIGISR